MSRRGGDDYAAVIATPLPGGWRLGLRFDGARLSAVDFLPAATALRPPAQPEAGRVAAALAAYLRSPATVRIELSPSEGGTPFQRRVWAALQDIPPGEVLTYGALADRLGSSARAVAAACRANPLPLVVPCHRVVAAHGPGGFMGASHGDPVALKQWLLDHERN